MIKKQVTIMGTIRDFHPMYPLFKMLDELYKSKYISFYEPLLEGYINNEKLISFNEKFKQPLFWPYKILKRTCKILNLIKIFKPDIVITHNDDANISILPTLFISKIILKKDIKFYAFIHLGIEGYKEKSFYNYIAMLFIKYFYKYFDKVYTVSKSNKELLQHHFNLKNIELFYLPIDIKKHHNLSKQPLDQNIKKIFKDFIFINIGRLSKEKGQCFLIRSFCQVIRQIPNTKLVILGEGELRDKLQRLVNKLQLQNNIYFFGFQKNPFKFLKYSNCLVSSSLYESWGRVLLEALSLNIPIISTDCKSGPREILCPELNIDDRINYPYYGKYGILTKPFPKKLVLESLDEMPLLEEEKMLAELMIRIIKDNKLRKQYSKGLERAKDFDIKNIIYRQKI